MYHWSAPLYFIGTPRQTLHVQLRQFRELQGQGGHQGPMRHRRQQLHLPAPHPRTVVIAVFFRSIQPDGGTYVFLTLHGGRAPARAALTKRGNTIALRDTRATPRATSHRRRPKCSRRMVRRGLLSA